MAEYEIPNDRRYTREDEWVRQDGDRMVVGVTDYAQQQLGDVVFVELPAVGSPVQQGKAFGAIESVKAVSDLFSPVTGEVVAVNEALSDTPEKINESCYEDGWILAIAANDDDQLGGLMDASAYRDYVASRDT